MTVANTVEKIRTFYKEELPTRIPFDTHPLKDVSEYAKDLYCTMLAVILQYENESMREQLIFLERISKGVGLETPIQNLMQKAKTVDVDFAKEFYEEFIDHSLATNFIVDALVMTNCREKVNGKQMEFLAEVVDVLNTSESDFQDFVQLALSILKQSKMGFINVVLEKLNIKYINQFKYLNIIVDTLKHANYLYKGSGKELKEFMSSESEILIFEDCYFNSAIEANHVENKKFVIFRDCKFENILNAFLFTDIEHLVFQNCIFKNSNRMMVLEDVQDLLLLKCSVKNISHSEYDYSYGGFINSQTPINFYMLDSIFENVQIKATNSSNPYSNGAIFAGFIQEYDIVGNQFLNCRSNGTKSQRALLCNNNGEHISYKGDFMKNSLIRGLTFKKFIKEQLGIELGDARISENEMKECDPKELIIFE